MAHKLKRVQGDTGEPVNFTAQLDNKVMPLTNAGVVADFIMKAPDGTNPNSGHTTCVIDNAANGTCHYVFEVGDLSQVGLYTCDFQVTDPTLPPYPLIVTEQTQYEITVRAQNG